MPHDRDPTEQMKSLSKVLLIAAGLILALPPRLDAGQGFVLSEKVQEALTAAEPVRGPKVDRELFNGKPVLVVFFASW